MLFNSYVFIFLFLPLTLTGYYLIGAWGKLRLQHGWLLACSLFFYGYWAWEYAWLLICSILVNFMLGSRLDNPNKQDKRKQVMWVGIIFNLGLLGYFKYTNFFLGNLSALLGDNFSALHILLPLGISFFTFQQIAYLVDLYQGRSAHEKSLLRFGLFVSFFPQLIAGPIVHHKQMMPQFMKPQIWRRNRARIGRGFSIFTMGLAKKILLADQFATIANPIFDQASTSVALSVWEAWTAVLAYALQLYFDFSGYSDMAIGLGLMFGVCLPANFNSPYKSRSVIEFWKRWHITLSKFMRDYVYVPLGGNRKGGMRQSINLLVTMLICGLWHGAGWNFIAVGALHGLFLLVNHSWRRMPFYPYIKQDLFYHTSAAILTFICVITSFVIFRSHEPITAMNIYGAIFDPFVYTPPVSWVPLITAMLALCWILLTPNTMQIFRIYEDKNKSHQLSMKWEKSRRWALITSFTFCLCILYMKKNSEFLYFTF